MKYRNILDELVKECNNMNALLNDNIRSVRVEYLISDANDPFLNEPEKYKRLTLSLYQTGIKTISFNTLVEVSDEEEYNKIFDDSAKRCLMTLLLTESAYLRDVKKGLIKEVWP